MESVLVPLIAGLSLQLGVKGIDFPLLVFGCFDPP